MLINMPPTMITGTSGISAYLHVVVLLVDYFCEILFKIFNNNKKDPEWSARPSDESFLLEKVK